MTKRVATLLPLLLLPLFHASLARPAGRHPDYLQALGELRTAYSLVQHRQGDLAVNGREGVALDEISNATEEIRQSAIAEGREASDHARADLPTDQSGALHQAVELLADARQDIDRTVDERSDRSMQRRALAHIDRARAALEEAISDLEERR